jgi:RNA polymerase sigma factor (sigma-70 family)
VSRITLNNSDETSLILQMRKGNVSAFNSIYKRYWKLVFNSAFKRLHDTVLAEDVTQEVFTQLWSSSSSNEIKDLPNYLYVATKNKVLRTLEKEERYFPVPQIIDKLKGYHESSDAKVLYDELYEAVQGLIKSFTPHQQQIFHLKYEENLSSKEIAEKLGLSIKTVRNHLGIIQQRIKSGTMAILISAIVNSI